MCWRPLVHVPCPFAPGTTAPLYLCGRPWDRWGSPALYLDGSGECNRLSCDPDTDKLVLISLILYPYFSCDGLVCWLRYYGRIAPSHCSGWTACDTYSSRKFFVSKNTLTAFTWRTLSPPNRQVYIHVCVEQSRAVNRFVPDPCLGAGRRAHRTARYDWPGTEAVVGHPEGVYDTNVVLVALLHQGCGSAQRVVD